MFNKVNIYFLSMKIGTLEVYEKPCYLDLDISDLTSLA